MGQATYSYGGRCELWGRLPIPMVGSELWGRLPIPMGQATYSYGGELTMGQAFFLPVKKAISYQFRLRVGKSVSTEESQLAGRR